MDNVDLSEPPKAVTVHYACTFCKGRGRVSSPRAEPGEVTNCPICKGSRLELTVMPFDQFVEHVSRRMFELELVPTGGNG